MFLSVTTVFTVSLVVYKKVVLNDSGKAMRNLSLDLSLQRICREKQNWNQTIYSKQLNLKEKQGISHNLHSKPKTHIFWKPTYENVKQKKYKDVLLLHEFLQAPLVDLERYENMLSEPDSKPAQGSRIQNKTGTWVQTLKGILIQGRLLKDIKFQTTRSSRK